MMAVALDDHRRVSMAGLNRLQSTGKGFRMYQV